MGMGKMAFYQKYRSKQFSELIGQDHISLTLVEAIKSDRLAHAYLLTGPRGTGKTSTARLLAKAINCQKIGDQRKKGEELSGEICDQCDSCKEVAESRSVDVIEIDAASHTGVDDIRELIDKARFSPVKSPKKIYIIDEVHMLSKSAFTALLKTLEEPPSHVIFILATTEVNKLPATILSRTQRYDFKRVSKQDIVKNLKRIIDSEKIKITDGALELIAISAEGGHRDAVGLLEQVASFSKDIKEDDVRNILGISRLKDRILFIGAIFNNNPEEGLKIAHRLYADGSDILQFSKDIAEILRKVLLLKISDNIVLDDITEESAQEMKELGEKVTVDYIVDFINEMIKSFPLIKDASLPLLPLEMVVIKCSNIGLRTSNVEVQKLENRELKPETTSQKSETKDQEREAVVNKTEDKTSSKQLDNDHKKELIEKQKPSPKAEPPIPDMVSAPVLEMTLDLWQKVIEETKKANTSLAALLRDTKPLEIGDDKIVLGVKFAFHKDRISDHKNCSALESIITGITGKKLKISCKLVERKKQIKGEGSGEDLEKAAEEIFA